MAAGNLRALKHAVFTALPLHQAAEAVSKSKSGTFYWNASIIILGTKQYFVPGRKQRIIYGKQRKKCGTKALNYCLI
jgi:hypothetical protein